MSGFRNFTKLERFELKYTIPFEMVQHICDFSKPYCSMDEYSLLSEDHYYDINNIYMDSPGFYLLKQREEGADNRFNLRVRSYGKNANLPFHLEVKWKKGSIIRKYRASVFREDWCNIFFQPGYSDSLGLEGESLKNLQMFERLAVSLSAGPVITTSYRRKALFSTIDDYVRLTFDTELNYMEAGGFNMPTQSSTMLPYDTEQLFDPGASVVFEIKSYAPEVPWWIVDLINTFDLRRSSFSKYASGMNQLRKDTGFYGFNQDFSVPFENFREMR